MNFLIFFLECLLVCGPIFLFCELLIAINKKYNPTIDLPPDFVIPPEYQILSDGNQLVVARGQYGYLGNSDGYISFMPGKYPEYIYKFKTEEEAKLSLYKYLLQQEDKMKDFK
jgi:hypothetical protein